MDMVGSSARMSADLGALKGRRWLLAMSSGLHIVLYGKRNIKHASRAVQEGIDREELEWGTAMRG